MSSQKLVSIIIPVYNVEKYIEECICSIKKQKYSNIEVILVDDGSTDRSGSICDAITKNDKRFYVFHKKNEGVSIARNVGLSYCSGEYITFIDPDDWVEDTFILELVKTIESYNVDSVCCTFFHTSLDSVSHGNPEESLKQGLDVVQNLMEENWYTTVVWNKLFRRDCVYQNENNFIQFQPGRTVGEDEKWLINIFADTKKSMKFINKKLYYWRIREESALHSVKNKVTRQMLDEVKTKEEIMEILAANNSSDIYKLAAKSLYEKTFVVCKYAFDFGEWSIADQLFSKMRYGRLIWLREECKKSVYSSLRRLYWEMKIYFKCKICKMKKGV